MYKDYIEIDNKLINKVKNATNINYDVIKFLNNEGQEESYINIGDLITALEDMYIEYDHMKELYDDLKQDVQDNYRHIPLEEQI